MGFFGNLGDSSCIEDNFVLESIEEELKYRE